jgi:putative ABC transport system permease protein
MFKNAARNRRRSLLTVCSIGASLCLLGVLMAIYHAFYFTGPTPEQARRLVTRNRISLTNIMPVSYGDRIRQIPGVQEVMILQWFGGVYKEPKHMFARMAVEPERFETVYPEYKMPADQMKAFQRERSACIIGRDLARKFNLNIGDRMTLKGDIFPVTMDFTIRGIYDFAPDNESMFFHLNYLFESLPQGRRDFAGTFVILIDSADNAGRISAAVDEQFRNSPVQTKTETEKAFQVGFLSFLGNVKAFLLSICGALTFTILLVTANTMAMSVRERIREVGVLKTLGYTNGSVLAIILGEAAMLSIAGGILGWALASGMAALLRQAPGFIAELKTLTIEPAVAAMLLTIAVLIGVVSSLIPAWNASRTKIIEALRFTG